jgi:hypothetical protein
MTNKIRCKNCNSNEIIKKGIRKAKLQLKQAYQCKKCSKKFTLDNAKTTYPTSIILKAISAYNLGCNLQQTQKKMEKTHNIKIPLSTISSWLNQYKAICTFARLRKQATKLYSPRSMIKKQTLSHIQPYTFQYHQAKLEILIKENPKFAPIKSYIEKISSKDFPHHIFTYDKTKEDNNSRQRASNIKFQHLGVKQIQKDNFACKLASLALNLASSNKERHQKIQDFMLINDSTTIATEIPIYLTNWDAGYYRNEKGFIFPLDSNNTPITGHIDILQIRNGLMHIIDYKPNAHKINPTEQLTIYALAPSRKLNLPLYHFKSAWFDESGYNEFYPLHAVYTKKEKIAPIAAIQ